MSLDCSVRASSPEVDAADLETSEIPLFQCGTWAPGHVHDPCQHSTYRVLCCQHAGCMADEWNCGAPMERPGSWVLYQCERMDQFFGELRGWRLYLLIGLWTAAIVVGWVSDMFAIMLVFFELVMALGVVLILFGVGHLLALVS